ncbi:hypothetical protein [Kriegella aquimaris]|uniref:Uncharacterized protein n=1 Tax=Kriegella aquimaris TaxID=192904 RepID=A0A1G9YSB6_9FLAO|nr:hypothetical protein [Kriegella aquimaris]SDN12024.1 hypothetical protein SAMN04488514_12618 [Kriegella aquimaris]
MKQFLLEVSNSIEADNIQDSSTIWLVGSMGKREGAVVLTVKPGGFDKPNSSFIHVKMKKKAQDYFIEGVDKLQLDNMKCIPIISITVLS